MRRFGGNFVRLLGTALLAADANNQQRIRDAFPDYWERYLNLGTAQQSKKTRSPV